MFTYTALTRSHHIPLVFEDFIIKYSWSAVGLLVASVPVFFPAWAGDRTRRALPSATLASHERPLAEVPNTTAEAEGSTSLSAGAIKTGSRTQGFITNKRLMISLADAGGRVMYAYKELAELAGYTSRVYELLAVFEDVAEECYVKTVAGEVGTEREFSLDNIRGKIHVGYNGVRMVDVPVVTPGGDVLVRGLSFDIKPGMHLLCTGPNGRRGCVCVDALGSDSPDVLSS